MGAHSTPRPGLVATTPSDLGMMTDWSNWATFKPIGAFLQAEAGFLKRHPAKTRLVAVLIS